MLQTALKRIADVKSGNVAPGIGNRASLKDFAVVNKPKDTKLHIPVPFKMSHVQKSEDILEEGDTTASGESVKVGDSSLNDARDDASDSKSLLNASISSEAAGSDSAATTTDTLSVVSTRDKTSQPTPVGDSSSTSQVGSQNNNNSKSSQVVTDGCSVSSTPHSAPRVKTLDFTSQSERFVRSPRWLPFSSKTLPPYYFGSADFCCVFSHIQAHGALCSEKIGSKHRSSSCYFLCHSRGGREWGEWLFFTTPIPHDLTESHCVYSTCTCKVSVFWCKWCHGNCSKIPKCM